MSSFKHDRSGKKRFSLLLTVLTAAIFSSCSPAHGQENEPFLESSNEVPSGQVGSGLRLFMDENHVIHFRGKTNENESDVNSRNSSDIRVTSESFIRLRRCAQKFRHGCIERIHTFNPVVDRFPENAFIPQDSAQVKATNSFIARFGNESNPVDGAFGPKTGGVLYIHGFIDGSSLEVGTFGLHEPGASFKETLLDEAQITWKMKSVDISKIPVVFAVTAWKNRMIDMYTNLGGLELEAEASKDVSVNFGAYAGTATKGEAEGRFIGFQAGVSVNVKSIQLALVHLDGFIKSPNDLSSIGSGHYSRTALEASTELNKNGAVPLTLTSAIEKRDYSFGDAGPTNSKEDRYIFVIGIEANIQDFIHHRNSRTSGER